MSVHHQRKSFATANSASPLFNFFIYPTDIVAGLAQALLGRKFCLLFGHRQSGKTTAAFTMIDYLNTISTIHQIPGYGRAGFEIYYVSLYSGIDFKNRSRFWESFCRALRTENHQRFNFEDSRPASSSTFMSFFSKTHDPARLPAILVIDEASMLTGMDNKIIDDFISTLRSLKDNHISFCLHSIVLVGTESVRGVLASRNVGGRSVYSPFTEEETFECTRFTVSEVEELLNQFVKANKDLDIKVHGIAKDIYELTSGHKGLVGVCGNFIEGKLLRNRRTVSLKDWKAHSFDLAGFVVGKQTYSSMLQCLPRLELEHRNILGNVLRHGFDRVQVSSITC